MHCFEAFGVTVTAILLKILQTINWKTLFSMLVEISLTVHRHCAKVDRSDKCPFRNRVTELHIPLIAFILQKSVLKHRLTIVQHPSTL